jgi:quercetin 2,3-dioxygenase
MQIIRPASQRGIADFGWLSSKHTFSFGEYHDDKHMGYRSLRVINDDRVAGGGGFSTHGHRDMEILSWVLEGELEHKDSMGNGTVIRPGELQRMSAGTGVRHSEHNGSKTQPVHFLQIWLLPSQQGLAPGYQQIAFAPELLDGKLHLMASADGRDGSILINQNTSLSIGRFAIGQRANYQAQPGHGAFRRRRWHEHRR